MMVMPRAILEPLAFGHLAAFVRLAPISNVPFGRRSVRQ
jgi:hypothetical protein